MKPLDLMPTRGKRTALLCVFFVSMGLALFTGCETKVDPKLAQYRTELLLSAEPVTVTSIEDAKKDVAAKAAAVTIEGIADTESLQSTGKAKALMLVRELLPDDHGHQAGHDPSSCPFCKRRLANAAKAAVEFVGTDGRVLPYAVDELFGLKQGDPVVVQGTAELDPKLNVLKITASGIYVRDPG